MITHCHFDHTGGGAAVRKEIGCKTVAHKLEALYLEQGDNIVTAAEWYDAEIEPFPVDVRLSQDKTDLQLGGRAITAIHAPGHSPGLTRSGAQLPAEARARAPALFSEEMITSDCF